jgi:type IV pilus assembly protein PilE
MRPHARPRGFTLIEVMVVVAMIAILAAIAVPAYQDFVRKARRADAKRDLTALQLAQERWRANNVAYTTILGPTGLNWHVTTTEGYYTLTITAATVTAYNITAAPIAGKSQAKDSCGTFAVNQNGPNTSGSYAKAECWR